MTMITLTQNEQPVSGGFRVDVSRGERIAACRRNGFPGPITSAISLLSFTPSRKPCRKGRGKP